MPSDANVVHVGSVHLDVDLLLRLVLAPELRAVMPHNIDGLGGKGGKKGGWC